MTDPAAGPTSSRGPTAVWAMAQGPAVRGQQLCRADLPAQLARDPLSPDLPHLDTARRVVEELEDRRCEGLRVIRLGVVRGSTGADACLLEIEGRHRQADGHVLERLVHGAELVE